MEDAIFNLDDIDVIDVEYGDNREWDRAVSTIIKIKDKLFCINWSQGLTEYQDNHFYEQPFEVEEKTETIVRKYYVQKKQITIMKFKDGDILESNGLPFIFNGRMSEDNYFMGAYCGIDSSGKFRIEGDGLIVTSETNWTRAKYVVYASEENKTKLYNSLLKYYNKHKDDVSKYLLNDFYDKTVNEEYVFTPFEKVIVSNSRLNWRCDFFSHLIIEKHTKRYVCITGEYYHCLPYNGNEHLIKNIYIDN